MPETRLAGRNALVTGSGRGIGQDIAMALGQEGANVSVHDLHSNDGALETVEAVLHEGVQAMAMQAHLSRGRDSASVVEPSVETFGRMDILVNNAGAIIQPAHGAHMRDEPWDQTLHVNLTSADQLINAMAPGMRERTRGALGHMTSVYGILVLVQ